MSSDAVIGSFLAWMHVMFIVCVVESILVTVLLNYMMSWGEKSVKFDGVLGSVGRNCWILNVRFVSVVSFEVIVPILIRNSIRGMIWYAVTSPIARISSDTLVMCCVCSAECLVIIGSFFVCIVWRCWRILLLLCFFFEKETMGN